MITMRYDELTIWSVYYLKFAILAHIIVITSLSSIPQHILPPTPKQQQWRQQRLWVNIFTPLSEFRIHCLWTHMRKGGVCQEWKKVSVVGEEVIKATANATFHHRCCCGWSRMRQRGLSLVAVVDEGVVALKNKWWYAILPWRSH